MLYVPSAFLYHPSNAGVTVCPAGAIGESDCCALPTAGRPSKRPLRKYGLTWRQLRMRDWSGEGGMSHTNNGSNDAARKKQ